MADPDLRRAHAMIVAVQTNGLLAKIVASGEIEKTEDPVVMLYDARDPEVIEAYRLEDYQFRDEVVLSIVPKKVAARFLRGRGHRSTVKWIKNDPPHGHVWVIAKAGNAASVAATLKSAKSPVARDPFATPN